MTVPTLTQTSDGQQNAPSNFLSHVRAQSQSAVVASILVFQIAGLGTTAAVPAEPVQRVSGWTSSGLRNQETDLSSGEERTSHDHYQSTAEAVKFIHDHSGLTWDQLAKAFGVSRRAVHLWAAGKAINARHAELVADLVVVVRSLPGSTAAERRTALLRPSTAGPSTYDQLRMDRANAQVLHESSFSRMVRKSREA
jgi:DNA-binding transcriptional regulator YiaG